jgi:hypothetical protein
MTAKADGSYSYRSALKGLCPTDMLTTKPSLYKSSFSPAYLRRRQSQPANRQTELCRSEVRDQTSHFTRVHSVSIPRLISKPTSISNPVPVRDNRFTRKDLVIILSLSIHSEIFKFRKWASDCFWLNYEKLFKFTPDITLSMTEI